MRRVILPALLAMAALTVPTVAQAATGTVLSVAPSKHRVQIVGTDRVVRAYSFSAKPSHLARGSELSFAAAGSRITQASVIGTANSFSFLAHVVRTGGGKVVLALGDSQRLNLTSRSAPRGHRRPQSLRRGVAATTVGTVTVDINGLQAGQSVLVTETTDAAGNVTVTITLPTSGGATTRLVVAGDVNNVNTDTFDIITADGSDLNFHMAADALNNVGMESCDAVVVTYHMDDQLMIADKIVDNGQDQSGNCPGGVDSGTDWIGTVTAVSATSITVDAGAGNGGPETFAVGDPSLTYGFLVGDSVDVTYEQDGSQLVADDVEYNDTATSGVVTAVVVDSAGFTQVKLVDDNTGQPETFLVPDALLDGLNLQIGDDVSVSYYQAAGGLTLDDIEDDGGWN